MKNDNLVFRRPKNLDRCNVMEGCLEGHSQASLAQQMAYTYVAVRGDLRLRNTPEMDSFQSFMIESGARHWVWFMLGMSKGYSGWLDPKFSPKLPVIAELQVELYSTRKAKPFWLDNGDVFEGLSHMHKVILKAPSIWNSMYHITFMDFTSDYRESESRILNSLVDENFKPHPILKMDGGECRFWRSFCHEDMQMWGWNELRSSRMNPAFNDPGFNVTPLLNHFGDSSPLTPSQLSAQVPKGDSLFLSPSSSPNVTKEDAFRFIAGDIAAECMEYLKELPPQFIPSKEGGAQPNTEFHKHPLRKIVQNLVDEKTFPGGEHIAPGWEKPEGGTLQEWEKNYAGEWSWPSPEVVEKETRHLRMKEPEGMEKTLPEGDLKYAPEGEPHITGGMIEAICAEPEIPAWMEQGPNESKEEWISRISGKITFGNIRARANAEVEMMEEIKKIYPKLSYIVEEPNIASHGAAPLAKPKNISSDGVLALRCARCRCRLDNDNGDLLQFCGPLCKLTYESQK